MNKALHQPVVLRHVHRTWLNHKGQVVATEPADQDVAAVSVKWEAKVIDAATEQPIETYPALNDTLVADADANHEQAAEEAYYNRLRFVDGKKLDIDLLQQNVNAGIWTVDVHLHQPTALKPQPVMNH
jgi:hypothetical protein